MKETHEGLITRRPYEAPKVEIIEIETQGMVCSSAMGGRANESVGIQGFDWI